MSYLHYISDHRCPRCDHASDFQVHQAIPCVEKKLVAGHTKASWIRSQTDFRLLTACGRCREPQLVDVNKKDGVNFHGRGMIPEGLEQYLNRLRDLDVDIKGRSPSRSKVLTVNPESFGIDLRDIFIVKSVYPGEIEDAPTDLPKELQPLWDDFEGVRESPRYTCVACRAMIEQVCKRELEAPKSNLMKSIDALVSEGILQASLGKWAHTIRLLGNESVHELKEITTEESMELKQFLKMFLELLYTYPAKVERFRANNEK